MTTGPDVSAPDRVENALPNSEPTASCRSPLGTFAECPMCGGTLAPEHAHFRCRGCGWRDSCCD